MRINVFSLKDYEVRMAKLTKPTTSVNGPSTSGNDPLIIGNEGWTKGGENILYKLSKIS